eukprot:TRINITY_DN15789_c0_g1_i1.p1 TRINITY_DN15789_c0_g1~~TRINITY_DN15789_c0_g1_i1.p1  ORF type:complete len:290 (+),score=35.55 TRINITY_DN15789_c0_g1_i1:3-872(+)
MSLLGRLKTFDFYRKVPTDLTQATVPGGIVSLICFTILALLFLSEFVDFVSIKTTSEMLIDVPRGGEQLRININISLPQLPCNILSLDAQDALGKHVVDVENSVRKKDEGEGCNIHGYLNVAKVPGNFHISSHGKSFSAALNLNHIVHQLSFGEAEDIKAKLEQGIEGAFNPLAGTSKSSDDSSVNHEYYIQVVPTSLERIDGVRFDSYQFTVNSGTWGSGSHGHAMQYVPAIYFRYELCPITVVYKQSRTGFIHFIVQLCAIIGGVFTVAGLVAVTSTKIYDKIAKSD